MRHRKIRGGGQLKIKFDRTDVGCIMLINFYYPQNDMRQTEFLTSKPIRGQDVSEEYVFRAQLFTNCYEPPVSVHATLDDQTHEFSVKTEDSVIVSD